MISFKLKIAFYLSSKWCVYVTNWKWLVWRSRHFSCIPPKNDAFYGKYICLGDKVNIYISCEIILTCHHKTIFTVTVNRKAIDLELF